MIKKHRQHLKTRISKPFNKLSKYQEDVAREASNMIWEIILKKYPELYFNNLNTLGLKEFNASHAIEYINRGFRTKNKTFFLQKKEILQAFDSAGGIRPDGGIFFVRAKKDGFDHMIGSIEVKHQGEYNGYTPISNSEWIKRKKDISIHREDRPPQAQGNAVERFAKNANAIKTLTSFYGYNPYVVFCEGFDFFLKKDFDIFRKQKYSKKFEGKDSSILMRLIAGNDWLPLNKIYVDCIEHGETKICPATIFARMSKWKKEEIVEIMLKVIDKSIIILRKIGEI